jgi:hypothetical protein
VVHQNGVVYLLRVPEPGQATRQPLDPDWVKRVQALKGLEQTNAVADELMRRNPWFDGKLKPKFLDGVAVSLELTTDEVFDVSPLRVLTGLKTLSLRGSAPGKSRLRDLSPLRDLPLEHLNYDVQGPEDRDAVRAIKTLQTVNGQDAAEFRKEADPKKP